MDEAVRMARAISLAEHYRELSQVHGENATIVRDVRNQISDLVGWPRAWHTTYPKAVAEAMGRPETADSRSGADGLALIDDLKRRTGRRST